MLLVEWLNLVTGLVDSWKFFSFTVLNKGTVEIELKARQWDQIMHPMTVTGVLLLTSNHQLFFSLTEFYLLFSLSHSHSYSQRIHRLPWWRKEIEWEIFAQGTFCKDLSDRVHSTQCQAWFSRILALDVSSPFSLLLFFFSLAIHTDDGKSEWKRKRREKKKERWVLAKIEVWKEKDIYRHTCGLAQGNTSDECNGVFHSTSIHRHI